MSRALALLVLGFVAMADEKLPDLSKLWNFQKPDETEKKFRALLPLAEASGDQDYLLQLKTQIARTLGLQGKFDAAHALLDEVEQELTHDLVVPRLRYLLERGRSYRSGKQIEKARPLFVEAWEYGLKHEQDYWAVDAAHMMGIAAETAEERRDWTYKGIDLAEKSKDERPRQWLGTFYNNLGWDLHDAGKYEESMRLLRKCLDWHVARNPGSRGVRMAEFSVAALTRKLQKPAEALAALRKLEETWEDQGDFEGLIQEEIAECLVALGKPEEAKAAFVKAFAALKPHAWFAEEYPARWKRITAEAGK